MKKKGQSLEPIETRRNDDTNVARQNCSQKGPKQAQVWNGLDTQGPAGFEAVTELKKNRQGFEEGAPSL